MVIRIFKTGRHAHRSPLSYPALADLFAAEIRLVARPQEADLYLFAHSLDLAEAPQELVLDWRRRRRPVVLLSEEPFWDTIWTKRPLERQIWWATPWGDLPVIQLNHHTSAIYRFRHLPYYLLTNHRFVNAYRYRFARNAARSAAAWREEFAHRRQQLVFMFERRPEPYHDVRWDRADLIGLCAWRSRLAEACDAPGVERLGRSWQPGQRRRQELGNWHMDKLMRLDGRARAIAAVENTHHPDYVTEKFFDAMACGAWPIYYASPQHRIHDFGLPEESWINLYGLDSAAAARHLTGQMSAWNQAEARLSMADFDAYRQGQARLAERFAAVDLLVEERQRLKQALLGELHQVLA